MKAYGRRWANSMTYKIRYLPLAVQDLNDIARYLSGFYPKTASRVLKEMRDKIMEMNRKIGGWEEGFDPFYGAPVILIVLADASCPTAVYDGSLTMGNLMLAAHDLGIGSCWIHRAKEEFESEEGKQVLESLGITGDYIGVGHCALGFTDGAYPDVIPRKDNRVYYIR